MKTDEHELYEYMLRRLGGADAVVAEYRRTRIARLTADGATLGRLLEEAASAGWREWLDGLLLHDLAGVIAPPAPSAEPAAPMPKWRRIPPAERAQHHDAILRFLELNPWSLKPAISAAVGLSPRTSFIYLRELRRAGQVQTMGVKLNMAYALAGAPPPAAAPRGSPPPPRR
jgi:hypothetical protein